MAGAEALTAQGQPRQVHSASTSPPLHSLTHTQGRMTGGANHGLFYYFHIKDCLKYIHSPETFKGQKRMIGI